VSDYFTEGLTGQDKYATYVDVNQLSTGEAAEAVGLDRITLQRWIKAKKVKAPKTVLRNGRGVRLWSSGDIERLREIKDQIHRKGRGRKPNPKR
jgi:excisionase family DNA binding protein